jgi:hypothetical protein
MGRTCHREAAGRGDLSVTARWRGLPRFARNDGMCARNDGTGARNDGVRARNNRAFGQPAHFRHREAAGCGDLSLPQLGRGLPRFARNDGMCPRNDGVRSQ